jgi:ABC-type Mn2+/Zn2+ transport system ATPase subunit
MADNKINAIEIKGLNVSYGNKRILTNIYLDIEQGYTYGIVGPNGAGKSTLIKSILDLIEYLGTIKIFGEELSSQRKRISYVPQRDEVDWTFPATVLDLVLMGRYPHKRVMQRLDENDKSIARASLRKLGIEDLENRQIGQLSGGQQQRVFIARALCQQADLYFFDEPFVGVDIVSEERIVEIMAELASQGKTVLVVHHDLSSVEKYFNKVIMINQRLIASGDCDNVFTQENISKCFGPKLSILNKTALE